MGFRVLKGFQDSGFRLGRSAGLRMNAGSLLDSTFDFLFFANSQQ